tara:strand:+ start:1777 stop:2040 length:264 start_codon:yes stop_codon:yes gene_type:complete
MIKALFLINNSIADNMARSAIRKDKLRYEEIFIIKQNKFQSTIENNLNNSQVMQMPSNISIFEKIILLFRLPYYIFKFKKIIHSKDF